MKLVLNLSGLALALAVLALPAACAAPAAPPEATVDLEAQRAELRAAAEAYHEAAQASDFDGVKALYAPDARIFAPNMPEESGTSGVDSFIEAFASLPSFEASFGAPSVEVGPDGGMGFTVASATLRFEGPDGAMVEEEHRDLHIWRLDENGDWKVVVDMWNSGNPLPETEP